MISLDTECTGLDFHHGAKPFLVTTCDEGGNQIFWEWEVDPLTREPQIPREDTKEIRRFITGEEVVFQNPKFDVQALSTIFFRELYWDWERTWDTLLAGHLLASNQPHDLTTMTLVYLGVNVASYEDAIKEATKKARRMCQSKTSKYKDWAIAKVGRKDMPSAKGEVWKMDMWLPRAIAKAEGYPNGKCRVVNKTTFSGTWNVFIGRGSIWGNPFRVGKDGDRREVIEKYRRYLKSQPKLLAKIPKLSGKTLGCFCKPRACHGDVLVEEVAKLAHPWWAVCSEYANSDSAATLPLFLKQRELLKERGHWKLYLERLKLLPVVYEMERRGVTVNRKRKEELYAKFSVVTNECKSICRRMSGGTIDELPVNGVSNALREVVFGKFGLVSNKQTPKGNPSMDKSVLEHWLATLDEDSKAYIFIKNLKAYRRRKTAMGYMDSYEKFWLPQTELDPETNCGYDSQEWFTIYPSLNVTGTDTLRWSSKNPCEHQISKQEDANLRYCFGPARGREWWAIDYSNLELRLAAYQAGEEEMIRLFEQPQKPPYYGSYHLLVFDTLHTKRLGLDTSDTEYLLKAKKKYKATWYQWTKNGNFAVQYGALEWSGTADRAYHVEGGQAIVADRFQKIKLLNQKWIDHAEKYGFVETMPDKTVDAEHGYPLLAGRTKWGKLRETTPLNYNIQGTACWVMSLASVKVHDYLKTLPLYHMILNVHDEVVLDFPKKPKRINVPKVRKIGGIMEAVGEGIGVPLTCEITFHSETWSEGVTL